MRLQYIQFAESLAKVSSLPVQSNLQLPRSHSLCKVQGAVASSICSAAWAPGGGLITHILLEEVEDPHTQCHILRYACFRLLSLHARKASVAIRP